MNESPAATKVAASTAASAANAPAISPLTARRPRATPARTTPPKVNTVAAPSGRVHQPG